MFAIQAPDKFNSLHIGFPELLQERFLHLRQTNKALGKPLSHRGRKPGYPGPPAQIRTCALTHPAPASMKVF